MPVWVSPGSGGGGGIPAPVMPSAAGFEPQAASKSNSASMMKRMPAMMERVVRSVHSWLRHQPVAWPARGAHCPAMVFGRSCQADQGARREANDGPG